MDIISICGSCGVVFLAGNALLVVSLQWHVYNSPFPAVWYFVGQMVFYFAMFGFQSMLTHVHFNLFQVCYSTLV